MNRIVLLLFLLLILTGKMAAQVEPRFSQHHMASGFYNPASAGSSGYLNATTSFKLFDTYFNPSVSKKNQGSTSTEAAGKDLSYYFVHADMPLKLGKTKHGVGAVFYGDNDASWKSTLIALQYSYKLKLFGGEMGIGIQPGVLSQNIDGTRLTTPDSGGQGTAEDTPGSDTGGEDPAIPLGRTVSGTVFDANIGVYYTRKNLYIGLGAMHITEPEISMDDTDASLLAIYRERTFNFTAGYNIPIKNSLFELQPSVFMLTNTNMFTFDITGRVVYNNRFNAGVSWRLSDNNFYTGLVFMLGAQFANVQVGYAFDTAARFGNTHELVARIRINLNKQKTGNTRHKSVRIL